MNKNEVKQTLMAVSFNSIKDLLLENKTDEAQVIVETLTTLLKEIDSLDDKDLSQEVGFKIGDFVTLDDPDNRNIINISSYRDIGYLDNVYKVKSIDNHCIYLKSIKNRYEASGIVVGLPWHNTDEMKRITKLNIKSPFVVMEMCDRD